MLMASNNALYLYIKYIQIYRWNRYRIKMIILKQMFTIQQILIAHLSSSEFCPLLSLLTVSSSLDCLGQSKPRDGNCMLFCLKGIPMQQRGNNRLLKNFSIQLQSKYFNRIQTELERKRFNLFLPMFKDYIFLKRQIITICLITNALVYS